MPPASSPEPHDRESLRDQFGQIVDRVEAAAIAAELDTGRREETIEEAKANALLRVARMSLGVIVVIIGIAALPLPGPGWLIIAGGLTILSKDVAWADRLLRYIRKRVPGIPEDGKIPRSSMVTMALVTAAAVSASLWWTLARGSDEIQAGSYTAIELTDPVLSIPDDDPGIQIELTTDGPVTLRADGCEPIEFVVANRSKTTFEVSGVNDPAWSCSNPQVTRFVTAAQDNELQLEYSTDGIVEWFLADNRLSSITADDEDGRIQLAVAPA